MDKNERKERTTNLYLSLLLPVGIAAIVWAIHGFPVHKINAALIVLSVVTIFFSSYLRIQLPRTKIHLTISDALIFMSLLLYGGEVSVLLAVLETTFTTLNFRRQGVTIKLKTVVINVLVSAVSVFVTALAVSFAFGPIGSITGFTSTGFIWVLAVMALAQFLVNSICVAAFIAIKTETTLWKVWNEYCLNALVMYISGAVMAGLGVKALEQINVFLFAAVIAFFALVYLTYRRYADDVKDTAAQAEQAERSRAEQAENHVKELQHYVAELEKSSLALRKSHEKFRHAAYHDALTGLPNRNYFLDILKTLLLKSRETADSTFAVLFLDLNRFKTMNDSLGHSMGDRLIKNVAKRLSNMVGEGDIVGRFSGDEFAIILTGIANADAVTAFADKVAHRISQPFTLSGRQVFTSVSIGIAFEDQRYTDVEDILRDADIAMYYAKDHSQNYVIFDPNMHTRAISLLQLETDLRYAIDRNELELFYQPVIGLDNVKLAGFEALVRWNHPQRGLIMPNEFIPVSEYTGLIIPMTEKILRQACRQMVAWEQNSPGEDPLTISVNLSGKHFAQGDPVEMIENVLAETQIDPSRLKLEITESAVMENAEHVIAMLRRIKETGVKLCIDDFGTGYSSLSYLQRFPLDTLKVDRAFVSSMEDGSENGEIVRTVIALAKALKLSVIAEGIENIHQLHQLRVLGCEYGQGYLFARPLPVRDVEKLLEERNRWQNMLYGSGFSAVMPELNIAQLRTTQ